MTAFELVRDGALLAAELTALLFVPPADAAPPAARLHELHALASAVDVRLLDSLASVRVVQTVRNDAPAPLDLAPRLPASDARIERLRVAQGGRTVDLLSQDSECSATESGPHEGRAQTTPDELRADLLTLPAGAQATIELVAAAAVQPVDGAVQIALPATSVPLPARAWLLPGSPPRLVIVAPPESRGAATLTVRPAHGATEVVALGALSSALVVVPLPAHLSAAQLAGGAIELETVEAGRVAWTTLPFVPVAAVVTAGVAR
jgi:hypothetical protein